MKKLIFGLVLSTLTIASFAIVAAPIIISGQPVILQNQNGVYYYPTGVVPDVNAGYYYYTVGDTNKVCYLYEPEGLQINSTPLRVVLNGTEQELNCYDVNPQYFIVQP